MDRTPTTVDPVLARVAARLLAEHHPDPADPRRCAHPRCRRPYPCGAASVATEAAAQSGTRADAGDGTTGREAAAVR